MRIPACFSQKDTSRCRMNHCIYLHRVGVWVGRGSFRPWVPSEYQCQQVPTGLVNTGLQHWPSPLETFEVCFEAYFLYSEVSGLAWRAVGPADIQRRAETGDLLQQPSYPQSGRLVRIPPDVNSAAETCS